MSRHRPVIFAGVALAVAAIVVASAVLLTAQEVPKPADTAASTVDLKPLVADFKAAFKVKDATAIAKLWTAEAELTTAGGDTVRGRKAIEAAYAELFKSRPNLTAEVENGEVRPLGPTAAIVEGVLQLTTPGETEPDVTLFRALVVKEADGWRFASVECCEADPEPATVAELEWLIGEWTGTGENGAELKAAYSWQEGKQFLRCVYSATRDGKTTGGTQVIGTAEGQLRDWLFDNGGTVGGATWAKDGDRWLIEAESTTPDGDTATATHVLVKLDANAFTWQSIDRTADGEPQPDGRPMKMTRTTKK